VVIAIAPESKGPNVRSDHSAKSPIVEKLRPGDRVFLEDGHIRNDDPPYPITWQKVTTMDDATGWIDFDYLAPSKNANQSSASAVPESPASAPATEETEVGRPVISSELSNADKVPGITPSPNGDGMFQLTREGGTFVWNKYPRPGDEASWSGDRDAEGYATGNGTITWFKRGRFTNRYTGKMVRGKLDGAVTNEDASGKKFHGTFINGVKSADWSRDQH